MKKKKKKKKKLLRMLHYASFILSLSLVSLSLHFCLSLIMCFATVRVSQPRIVPLFPTTTPPSRKIMKNNEKRMQVP